MEVVLSAKGLTIGYSNKKEGTLEVQRGLNLELRAGELTSLMGQNGVGKSTLIRCLAGFSDPLKGEVLVHGKPIGKLSEREISKLVSVVLTENISQIGLSVYELVSTGRYPYTGFFAKLSAEDHAKVEESLQAVGMSSFADRMLNELSDGERQKVMVAKALAQETPIVILDEPTAFLDLPSRIELMNLLHQLASEHEKAVLLSTHDLEQALRFSDTIWLIDGEKSFECGSPEDLLLQGKLKAFFGRDGIIFDNHSGTFRTENPFSREIELIGDGLIRHWVANALYRNGFTPSMEQNLPLCIEICSGFPTEFILSKPNAVSVKMGSVASLMRELRAS
ncbi:ABC transporter ATP-binding protein [Williamwhitmania taraxaci]|uniref:Iron complex transport system ATP-binding protein n=1 Tax=Williamwhitmania taraxaci TaxID=1640674 RepID=A0A1G6RKF3_9BACT|nr:ABC transporter ATP-binding protein [Williamwhitmania taraxaci]SDD04901.1 iron complex transport system ATP-binding protein [Williamwhitmania taraxaci]